MNKIFPRMEGKAGTLIGLVRRPDYDINGLEWQLWLMDDGTYECGRYNGPGAFSLRSILTKGGFDAVDWDKSDVPKGTKKKVLASLVMEAL